MLPLEAVPNFSEGRDRLTIAAIGEALAEHARVLDVHSDPDHNRSVYSIVGSEQELGAALLGAVETAREMIDLRRQEGAHPRIGAADVVPIVPIRDDDAERARSVALELGRRVGEELTLPVFLYGELAPGLGPAFFRRGGPSELQRRMDAGELVPDFGPARLDERAGAVLVGARRPLIAFNVNLAGDDLEAAREVARAVRERDGGLPGVRALGLRLQQAGHVQVSLNIEDWRASPLHEVVAAVRREASARGLRVTGSELVGLLPAGSATAAAGSLLGLAGLDPSHVLELRVLGE
jgi:glutamate formiminotransferase